MTDDPTDGLLALARQARANAYAPYSGFRVGAALRSATGAITTGVNVENAAYPATLCAERVAIGTLVAGGDPGPVVALAVVGDGAEPTTPCGTCRQVLAELAPSALVVAAGAEPGDPLVTDVGALLPASFTAGRLGSRT